MGWLGLAFAALTCGVFLGPARGARVTSRSCIRPAHSDTTVYNFTLPDLLETRNVSLSEYEGKILLLVNVATYWGFTWHYSQMNALTTTYDDNGFKVLGFPCNQFGKQEPGGNGIEIINGIRHVRPGNGFEPNFPLFKKIDVNGETEHPLYTFLKENCPPTRDEFAAQSKLFYTPMRNRDIRWNFEKILVDRTGMPVMRYDPAVKPEDIAKDIDYLVSQS